MLRLTWTEPVVARPGRMRASLVSLACVVRGLPLLFRAAPGTPLRVLCIVALDTLHVLRHTQPLPHARIHDVALFLDFAACANAAWDHKALSEAQYQALRQRLETAGLGVWLEDYLARLRTLESRRPSIGGGRRRFDEVRAYREAVVRLALAAVIALAFDEHLDESLRSTHGDGDVQTLFSIAMQCQVIDDVLDYRADRAAGLPSLLTASASLAEAMTWTARAARDYAASREVAWPLRVALGAVTVMAHLVVRIGRLRTEG